MKNTDPGFGQLDRFDRRDNTGTGAKQNAHAALFQAANAVVDGVAPDRIVDDIDATSIGVTQHLLAKIGLPVQDGFVGAAFSGGRRLLLIANRREHAGAARLRELDQQLADAAGAGMDQTGMLGAEAEKRNG